MMKKLLVIIFSLIGSIALAQTVFTNDFAFESYLESLPQASTFNSPNDDEVLFDSPGDLDAVTSIDISNGGAGLGVTDITGINDFTNLQNLVLDGNQIADGWLFLQVLTLRTISAYNCNLSSAKFCETVDGTRDGACQTFLTNVTDLNLGGNNFTGIGGLGGVPNLLRFLIRDSPNLTSLNCTGAPLLEELQTAFSPNMTTLTISNNPALRELFTFVETSGGIQGTLDLTNNVNLEIIGLENNRITSIVWPSSPPPLTQIFIRGNQLTDLDLRPLNTLNINDLLTCGNPLTCIQVDDVGDANSKINTPPSGCEPRSDTFPTGTGWWIDDGVSFTTGNNCVTCTPVSFNDPNLLAFFLDTANYDAGYIRDASGNMTIDDLVFNNQVCQELAQNVTLLNLSGEVFPNGNDFMSSGFGITSLVGIEFFSSLQTLYAQNNDFQSVDLTSNSQLVDFRAFNGNGGVGPLQSVNLQNLTNLQTVGLNNNVIDELLLQNNSALQTLNVSNNQINGSFDFRPFDQILSNFSIDDNPGPLCIQVDDKAFADSQVGNGWTIGTFSTDIFQEFACGLPTADVSLPCCAGSELDEFGGTITATVSLTDGMGGPFNNPDCCNDIVVEIGLQEGTAVAADLNEVFPLPVNIGPGLSSATFDISAFDDRIIENLEAASLVVNTGAGYVVDPATADFTIADNEQCCGFDVILEGPAAGTEGDQLQFTVRLQTNGETPEEALVNGTGSDFTFPVVYTDGVAVVTDDYTGGATVTIADGASQGTFDVDLVDDPDPEPDEDFTITLGTPTGIPDPPGNPTNSPPTGVTVTISDNDSGLPTATVSLPCCAGSELDEFGGTITATVTLTDGMGNTFNNPDCCNDIVVEIGLQEGTAVAADLNEVFPLPVNIGPGLSSNTFTISAFDDRIIENLEAASLVVNTGAGYVVDPATADFTITDNEQCCGFDAILEGTGGTENGQAQFTLRLQTNGETPEAALVNGTGADFVFPIAYTNGTAEAGDYAVTVTEIRIPDGSSEATVQVDLLDDADTDDETFTVAHQLPTGIPDPPGDPSLVPVGGVEVTITDDDEPTDNNTPDVSANTFVVSVLENSCVGQANGVVELRVNNTSDTFNVTFNGQNEGTISQGQQLLLSDELPPGEYILTVTAAGFDDWEQEFRLQVGGVEPISIQAFSIDQESLLARLRLEGSESYAINMNGKEEVFTGFDESTSAFLEIPLEKGVNRLVIQGEKACQGIIEKQVVVGKVLAHPVPVNDWVNIEGLPPEVPLQLRVFDILGRSVSEWSVENAPAQFQMDLGSLGQGMYLLRITGEGFQKEVQLLKN